MGCLLSFVDTSGLSAGSAAAAALELEAASTWGVDFDLDLDEDDARVPPLIVVGTFCPFTR